MDKFKVLVGLVYTQLMFCDEHGKLQFHRVMTDADRPWISIKEVLRMVKQALCMDKPIGYNRLFQSVHIDIQYWGDHFDAILQTMRKKMERYLPKDCELSIQTIKDYDEIVGERTEKKVDDWEASIWEFSPLEAIHHNEDPDIIQQVLVVQKECNMPLLYSEYGTSIFRFERNEPNEPIKRRISNCQLEDSIPILAINGGQSSWKKENNLRGSPNVSHSYIRKEGGSCSQPEFNDLVFAGHRPTMSLFFG